jgi:hypothetical protein
VQPDLHHNKIKDLGESWLGCQDSNLGMSVPKTDALPLGDTPTGAVPTRFDGAAQHDGGARKNPCETLERDGKRGYNPAHRDWPQTPQYGAASMSRVAFLTEYSAAW